MTLKPNAFRLAADLIANSKEQFACLAINHTDHCYPYETNPHNIFFSEYFKPEQPCATVWFDGLPLDRPVAKEHRIFALLFTELLCKDHNKSLLTLLAAPESLPLGPNSPSNP